MGDLRRGFGKSKPLLRTVYYWICCYVKNNEDDPISTLRTSLSYKAGQNKEKLMLANCNQVFKDRPEVWEILVHQGPNSVPESGDQIVARLSRERFEGSKELLD
jgi:hypothetical protein